MKATMKTALNTHDVNPELLGGTAEMSKYRVWPDGTVQDSEDPPHSWMSDDYLIVDAVDEDSACAQVNL